MLFTLYVLIIICSLFFSMYNSKYCIECGLKIIGLNDKIIFNWNLVLNLVLIRGDYIE